MSALGSDLRCRLGGATGASNWVAHAPLTPEQTFQCSEDLQRDPLDPARMAAAVVAQWQPGPSVAALRPVVEALLETQRRKPAVENPLEEVPENVYVMF